MPHTVFCLLLLFNSLMLRAQTSFDSSYANAISVYTTTIGLNQHIYNGAEYIDYDHRITGSPFFEKNSFVNGSIVYDGILYNNVQLIYDIWRENVVIKNYNRLPLLLINEKVSAFDLEGHQFIKITTDSLTEKLGLSGFYNVLCNGTVKLFAKRKKLLEEKITTPTIEASFIQKNEYYILNNSVFYAVANKKSLLNALDDQKPALQKYIKQQKLKFRKTLEADLIKAVVYYGSINQSK